MLRYNRKNKNLKIPVGIGTNNNVDSSLLFNVSDGDATAGDLVAGKTAYSAEGFLVGTLDLEGEKTSSYNEGYSAGEQDGYVSGEADGYSDGYSEGKEDGIEEILTEQSDANITPGSVLEGYIGYGANNERIVGTNVGGFDFGEIGYTEGESNECNVDIKNTIAYTKSLMPVTPSTSMVSKFSYDNKLVYAPFIDTSITTNMNYIFKSCGLLKFVPLFNTSNVTNMGNMFDSCSSLIYVPLFDTSKVTNMYYMFYGCNKLTTVPFFDTGNVTDMGGMFSSCQSLTTIPSFNTSKVTNMGSMFEGCSSLTSVPLFDTSKVTAITRMFYNCRELKTIPLFDISNVTSVANMLGSTGITELPSLNTSNVTNIDGFLRDSSIITIPSLDLGAVNNTGGYGTWNGFNNMKDLENVAALNDFGKSFTGSSTNGIYMSSSTKLTRQSCLNIFNTIYDMNSNNSYTGVPSIRFNTLTRNILSDEDIAIATNKGWKVEF